jgi:hypothetical protein
MLSSLAYHQNIELTHPLAFSCFELRVELVRAGLATAKAERVRAGSKTIEVARVRITEAGAAGLKGALS